MANATNPNLPTPDFSATPLACVADLRPYREGGYRLEAKSPSPGRVVVHNYGHGGAGITLSWGTAHKVRDLVRACMQPTDKTVAVLGSGVMGLTAATQLLELGLNVTIYTEKLWSQTTSAIAGGQWAASKVDYSNPDEFKSILEISYSTFKAGIGKGYGVCERPNYTIAKAENLELVMRLCPGLLPDRKDLPRLPFEHHTKPGFVYRTLLIEPLVFLKKLDKDLRDRGVGFVCRTFSDVASVLALPERIIVNCTGLGSQTLWNDPKLQPIKGQLVLLPPQPELQYLYSQNGYIFPRTDAVVIGGSFEKEFTTTTPDRVCCKELVDYLKGQFGRGPEILLPDCHIHHPSNLPELVSQHTPVS